MHFPLLTATVIAFLTLATTIHAGSFQIKGKNHWYGQGCDLKIKDVCGCSKTLSINGIHTCESLPDVFTHGNVCGGHWTMDVHHENHAVRFYGKGGCNAGCYLNSRTGGAKCESRGF